MEQQVGTIIDFTGTGASTEVPPTPPTPPTPPAGNEPIPPAAENPTPPTPTPPTPPTPPELTPEEIAAKAAADAAAEADKLKSTELFNTSIAERTEGKFKSWDDYINHVKELEEKANQPAPKHEYKSRFAAKLDEYVAQGGDEETFLATQTLDLEATTPYERAVYKLTQDNPEWADLKPEQVARLMERKFQISKWKDKTPEDYLDNEELREEHEALKIEYELAANSGYNLLKSEKEKWAVPQKAQPVIDESEAQFTAYMEKYTPAAKTISQNLNSIETSFGEKGKETKISYALTPEQKTVVEKKMLALAGSDFAQDFVDPKTNTLNMQAMASTIAKGIFFDEISKEYAKSAYAEGAKSIGTNLKNIDFSADNPNGTAIPKFQSKEEAVAWGIANQHLINPNHS